MEQLVYLVPGTAAIFMFMMVYSILYNPVEAAKKAKIKPIIAKVEFSDIYRDVLKNKKKGKSILDFIKVSKVLEDTLAGAGVKFNASEYIAIQTCVTMTPVFIGSILNGNLIFIIGISIVCFAIPPFLVQRSKKKREDLFAKQLGDSLVIMCNSMHSGYSFQQAMASIAKDMQPPISTEFARVLREMSYGLSMEEAMYRMRDRMGNEDLEILISAVSVSNMVGGNLSEILKTISETIKERIALRGEIKTLSAQGRTSGLIIGLLPVAIALMLMILNPDYIKPLLEKPLGHKLIIIGLIMEAIGFSIMRKITDIKY